ncbi:MAG: Hsp70 family protein, partial [Mesotoga sp.]|nr:Hsp70 family protein [Mesotoga sp.]
AEQHAEEDKRKRELVEARNHAYSVAGEIGKQLKDYGDKLSEADKKELEEKVKKLEELSQDESATKESLDSAVQDTLQSAQKIGEVMQQASQAKSGKDQPADGKADDSTKDNKADNQDQDKGDAEEGQVIEE